jgi:glycerol-3-phosphate acyltransferase PlsY
VLFPVTTLLITYLLGSIPTGLLVSRRLKGVDVRDHGSGGSGATNVLRVVGWKGALPVLLVDLLKGFLAVALVRYSPWTAPDALGWLTALAGVGVISGHVWPVLAGFRGGKGVATSAGVWLAIHPIVSGGCVMLFAVVFLTTRRVALASLSAVCAVPPLLWILSAASGGPVPVPTISLAVLGAAVVALAHRRNIHRLLTGTEPRVGD